MEFAAGSLVSGRSDSSSTLQVRLIQSCSCCLDIHVKSKIWHILNAFCLLLQVCILFAVLCVGINSIDLSIQFIQPGVVLVLLIHIKRTQKNISIPLATSWPETWDLCAKACHKLAKDIALVCQTCDKLAKDTAFLCQTSHKLAKNMAHVKIFWWVTFVKDLGFLATLEFYLLPIFFILGCSFPFFGYMSGQKGTS